MSSPCESEAASCCARFYEDEWVQQMLGESFHPGGLELSGRVIESLDLPADASVLDVACGIGSTSLLMAQGYGLLPTGMDASASNLAKARKRAAQASEERCRFVQGTASSLPFADESFDAVICECALSAFPNQSAAVAEFVRVLKPGGTVGISDMCVEGELPKELRDSAAPWTCLSGAPSIAGYDALFDAVDYRRKQIEDESAALAELIDDLKRKLLLVGVAQLASAATVIGVSFNQARRILDSARGSVQRRSLKYVRFVYRR